MRRRKNRRWSAWKPEEDRLLRAMWREGKYDREIGAVLGRYYREIYHRRLVLGLAGVKYRGHPPEVRTKIKLANCERWKQPDIAGRMRAGLDKARAAWQAMLPEDRRWAEKWDAL
jgi:hypothetical protein